MDESAARTKFGLIYDQHRRAVFAYCRRRANEQDALEVMNQTFATAWRRIEALPEPDAALPWLYSTARGQLSNQRRGRRRFARLIEKTGSLAALPELNPESQVVRRQELTEVAEALARLKPSDREVLRLAIWEELTHRQIGEVLGVSENAASQRIGRAVRRLTAEVNRRTKKSPAPRAVENGDAA